MASKILIIDDEKDMRAYLSALFKKAGYEVESASNGEEGLEVAKTFMPDLITLDVTAVPDEIAHPGAMVEMISERYSVDEIGAGRLDVGDHEVQTLQ